jgi:hypothetical protein
MSEDDDLHGRINALVEEEHRLRDADASPERTERLAEVERRLDQVWDLLRRREAAREFGQNDSQVRERPESEVEGYLQ